MSVTGDKLPGEPGFDIEHPLFLSSLAKSFMVLEVLHAAGRPVGLTELAELAQLNRSMVQRITHTLNALGYLDQHATTRALRLSSRIVELGRTVLTASRVREIAAPHLDSLKRRTGETVNLIELDGDEIVYVARYSGAHVVNVDLPVGARLPIFCTSAGRAMLSVMDESAVLAQLGRVRRSAMTPRTVTDLSALVSLVAAARQLGHALVDQETFVGGIGVAAALFDRAGAPVGAINITVPTTRWAAEEVRRSLAPQVMATARNINAEFRDS